MFYKIAKEFSKDTIQIDYYNTFFISYSISARGCCTLALKPLNDAHRILCQNSQILMEIVCNNSKLLLRKDGEAHFGVIAQGIKQSIFSTSIRFCFYWIIFVECPHLISVYLNDNGLSCRYQMDIYFLFWLIFFVFLMQKYEINWQICTSFFFLFKKRKHPQR